MPLNPPDRLQLLDIVLEVLEAPPGMQPGAGMSYDARIALSLLRLIRRELELGDRLAADETKLLGDQEAMALVADD